MLAPSPKSCAPLSGQATRQTSPLIKARVSRSRRDPRQACMCAATDPKLSAAKLFCDHYVQSDTTIGAGSGELCSLVIETIGARLASGELKGVQVVASSTGSAAEAAFRGVPCHPSPEQALQAGLDLAFEEANQLDVAQNACIIGMRSEPQQPALLSTFKIIKRAKQFVLLVDQADLVDHLKGPLPVLIEDATWEETAEEVDDLVVGDAEVSRRPMAGLPNPDFKGGDYPYVSEEGHNILDLDYGDEGLRLFSELAPYSKLLESIMNIPGVVLTGLLLGLAQAAVVVKPDRAEEIRLEQQRT